MRVYVELAVFSVIAVGIHAAGFVLKPEEGDQSSGDDGVFLLSLQASTAQMDKLVADWTAEPVVTVEMSVLADTSSVPDEVPTTPNIVSLPDPGTPSILPTRPTSPSVNSDILLPEVAREPAQKPDTEADPIAISKIKPKSRPAKIANAQKPKPEPKAKPEQAKEFEQKPKQGQTTEKKQTAISQAGKRKQKAAGQGGQTSAGSSGKAAVKSGSEANVAKALDVWGAQVRRSIERRKKSVRGLKRRVQATVSVTVAANGQILSYRIVKSAGNKKADTAALRAVNSAGRVPKAVKGVAVSKHTFRIPMIFNP